MRISNTHTALAIAGLTVLALTGCSNSSGGAQGQKDGKPTPLSSQQMAAMQKSITNDPGYQAAQKERAARAGRIHPVLAPGATIPGAPAGK